MTASITRNKDLQDDQEHLHGLSDAKPFILRDRTFRKTAKPVRVNRLSKLLSAIYGSNVTLNLVLKSATNDEPYPNSRSVVRKDSDRPSNDEVSEPEDVLSEGIMSPDLDAQNRNPEGEQASSGDQGQGEPAVAFEPPAPHQIAMPFEPARTPHENGISPAQGEATARSVSPSVRGGLGLLSAVRQISGR